MGGELSVVTATASRSFHAACGLLLAIVRLHYRQRSLLHGRAQSFHLHIRIGAPVAVAVLARDLMPRVASEFTLRRIVIDLGLAPGVAVVSMIMYRAVAITPIIYRAGW